MGEFSIHAENLHWIDGSQDDTSDLCLHGDATAIIGNETYKYNVTVSATALYLLKSLTEDHIINTDNQMLPCCGFFIVTDEGLTNVAIVGCDNGIDWTILHNGDLVKIVTENKTEVVISIDDYRDEVFKFADKIELFYKNSSSRELPEDEFDRMGYIAFWNEWHSRRNV